ncbi:TPA: hypothetical protein HA253_03130 [Candidatus Woesearchaeota archaeon]|nr:hypothetical protein [Candidatus Woesearchaeota archaeon]
MISENLPLQMISPGLSAVVWAHNTFNAGSITEAVVIIIIVGMGVYLARGLNILF